MEFQPVIVEQDRVVESRGPKALLIKGVDRASIDDRRRLGEIAAGEVAAEDARRT